MKETPKDLKDSKEAFHGEIRGNEDGSTTIEGVGFEINIPADFC